MSVCRRPNCDVDGRDVLGGLCTGHYGVKRSKEISEEKEKNKTKEDKSMKKSISEDLECKKCHKLATHIVEKAGGNRSAFNFKQGLCRSCVNGNNKKPSDGGDNESKPAKTIPVKTVKKSSLPTLTDEDTIAITIDFTKYPELIESIMQTALEEYRTPEMQILKILSENVNEV